MKKNAGLQYVKDFSFPSEQGFTGSAGKSEVKGYMRGGQVRSRNKPNKSKKLAKGTTRAAMGGYMGPEREITVDDVKISTPRRARGGKMSMHDKLKKEGGKMGYAYGGRVKDTSGEFKEKRGKQDSMDHGVQPARRGGNARSQQEKEAGGTGRLKPGLKKGGKVKHYAGGGLAVAAASAVRRVRSPDHTRGKGRSKKGMPKGSAKRASRGVKAKGGTVKMGEGGYYGKPGDKYPKSKARQKMPAGVKARGGKVRKPYTGYNQQPGGSGNEDARYMGKAGAAR